MLAQASGFPKCHGVSVPACRAPIQQFLENAEASRLLFFIDGKDLAVVRGQLGDVSSVLLATRAHRTLMVAMDRLMTVCQGV